MSQKIKTESLEDILGIVPPEFLEFGLDHYSPTQMNMPLALWAYKYVALDQDKRRNLKTNVNMFFGTVIGSITQMMFCDEIWTYSSNKVENNNKMSMDQALETLNDEIRAYAPWDQKDREKFEAIKHLAPAYLKNSYDGFKSIDLKTTKNFKVTAERNVTLPLAHINMLGRIDGEDELKFIEQKCKLPKLNAVKKDGTRSVSTVKIPEIPQIEHCRQTSFYHFASGQKRPFLLYVNDKEHKIFDSSNCDLLTADAMAEHMEFYRQQARLRDRHIINSKGSVKRLLSFMNPDFEHAFYWDLGEEQLATAKEAYKQAHDL
tara:strand:- start:5076 stop:6029 length:954 start_codon:yes stop_codon:yes gene_type:complete